MGYSRIYYEFAMEVVQDWFWGQKGLRDERAQDRVNAPHLLLFQGVGVDLFERSLVQIQPGQVNSLEIFALIS